MLQTFKSAHRATIFANPDEVSLGELLNVLDADGERLLVFVRNGRPTKPGYHLTEVKAGQFAALDCGTNPESWTENILQLWDAGEAADRPMTAGKFAGIIRKVSERIGLDMTARLTFEVSDGVEPLELYRAAAPRLVAGAVQVPLTPRPASCKPRDRWLAERHHASGKVCCGQSAGELCCG